MNNFQTILVAIFMACFVFAVLIFSGLLKLPESGKQGPSGKLVVWGTFSNNDIFSVFEDAASPYKELNMSYVRKNPSTYENDLIQAFAKDQGPDLFFMTPSMIEKYDNFVYKIPYAQYPIKTFKDSFIDGADVFLDTEGTLGFPIIVDPLVLYFNKDILSNKGIASPVSYWDELFNYNSVLTKQDENGLITSNMIAMGRYDNVVNAKDILATLLLQNGNAIVKRSDKGLIPVLAGDSSSLSSPAEAVFSYFMEFSNPNKTAYSWNRSLPSSTDMFASGKMAFYLGRASELFNIEKINPNLSYEVTEIPQTKNSNIRRTYGEIYALSVNKNSTNIQSAIEMAGTLSSSDNAFNFSKVLNLPPVLKSLLATKPEDAHMFSFYNSALISRDWLDPDEKGTDQIFGELIENLLSNKLQVEAAVSRAQDQLELLIK